MSDKTENPRREQALITNAAAVVTAALTGEEGLRSDLELEHGKDNVWDGDQMQETFKVRGFAAPYVIVTRKSDGAEGSLVFTHRPRFYFKFVRSSK